MNVTFEQIKQGPLSNESAHYAMMRCLECHGFNVGLSGIRRATGVGALRASVRGVKKHEVLRGLQKVHLGGCVIEASGRTPLHFHRLLVSYLQRKIPCVIYMENEDRWIAVTKVHVKDNETWFTVIDSQPRVDGYAWTETWDMLLRRIGVDKQYAIAVY